GNVPATASVHPYVHTWSVPESERGLRFWYRAAYTQVGHRYAGPAVAWTSPAGPRIATLSITIVHNALDSDLESLVRAGYPTDGGPTFELPGTAGAVSSDIVDGSSGTGDAAWTLALPAPAGLASSFLPPSSGNPWTLSVQDAGSLTRSGRVSDFRLVWHAPGGDQEFVGTPLPQQTVEGGTVQVQIPAA